MYFNQMKLFLASLTYIFCPFKPFRRLLSQVLGLQSHPQLRKGKQGAQKIIALKSHDKDQQRVWTITRLSKKTTWFYLKKMKLSKTKNFSESFGAPRSGTAQRPSHLPASHLCPGRCWKVIHFERSLDLLFICKHTMSSKKEETYHVWWYFCFDVFCHNMKLQNTPPK